MTLVQLDEAHALKKKRLASSGFLVFGCNIKDPLDNKNLLRAVLKDILVSSNTSCLLLK